MPALYQRTRRRICQAAFCLLCAMPTTGLLAWTASMRTTAYLAQWRTDLGQRLGLAVRCQEVRYPRPGQSLFEGFELADPETGEWVLRCRSLEVSRMGRKLVLAPSDVELAAERADKLLRLVMRRLAHELSGAEIVSLVPTQVTLSAAAGSQTYDDVSGRLEIDAETSSASLRFGLPEPQPGEPPLLTIMRRRASGGVSTTVTLDTQGAVLPVSMFAPWLDLTDMLGAEASFRGSLAIVSRGGRLTGEASGELTQVDLERLIARRFPHHLKGRATIALEHARLNAGRLTEAVGSVRCDWGTIGGSLLAATVHLLDCRTIELASGQPPFSVGKNHRFRDLGVRFKINENGLWLASMPEAEPAAALLLDHAGSALLYAPTEGPVALTQLLRALVPASQLQVPATRQTALLVPWLPLPTIDPSPQQRPPVPPLRAGE